MVGDRSTTNGPRTNGGSLPPIPMREELKALAAEPDPLAPGWTRAGRTLQKQGYRPNGSVYPRPTGPATHYNSVAQRIVEDIIDGPGNTFSVRLKRRHGRMLPFVEVIAVDGRRLGYRWEPALQRYRFEGFREL